MLFSTNNISFSSPSSLFSAYASLTASIMLFRSMANELIPSPIRNYLYSKLRIFVKPKTSTFTIVIEESDGFSKNIIYDAAERYLCTKVRSDLKRMRISKSSKDKRVRIHLERGENIPDSYEGMDVKWSFKRTESSDKKAHPHDNYPSRNESQCFELCFHKKDKDTVLESYIPYILEHAKSVKEKERILKMYTLNNSSGPGCSWQSVNLEHPSTFDTLAMEPDQKRDVMKDLDRFLGMKELCKKVGRAWKRGYLLYGPPGTGKSSLVAAMANYLKFDVYDLQLANVMRDSDLRRLLLSTGNRSILVIEDIDCSVDLPDRHPASVPVNKNGRKELEIQRRQPEVQLTLSGLLNFIDGLWSSCGDERIIIFTTNHKDKLDPALLRPGRMDMHIHMSYCTFHGFKLLASNYLGVSNHPYLFGEIENLIGHAKVTPAEVAGEFMKNEDANAALGGLVELLKRKRMDGDDDQETDETQGSKAIKYPQVKRVKVGKKPRKSPRVLSGSMKKSRGRY